MKATVYLEHNNAGKIILYNYNGKWWYEDIASIDNVYDDCKGIITLNIR